MCPIRPGPFEGAFSPRVTWMTWGGLGECANVHDVHDFLHYGDCRAETAGDM